MLEEIISRVLIMNSMLEEIIMTRALLEPKEILSMGHRRDLEPDP